MYLFMFNKARKLEKIGCQTIYYTTNNITLRKGNKRVWFKVDYDFNKKSYYIVDFKVIRGDKMECKRCGSTNLTIVKKKTLVTNYYTYEVTVFYIKCNNCGYEFEEKI